MYMEQLKGPHKEDLASISLGLAPGKMWCCEDNFLCIQ